jgi:hypothetical protein
MTTEPHAFVIQSFTFLDWWNDQTVCVQRAYLKNHSRTDRNYPIALANAKQGAR